MELRLIPAGHDVEAFGLQGHGNVAEQEPLWGPLICAYSFLTQNCRALA